MATYVLLHGAGSDSWYWHRVVPLLRRRGHDVVAPDPWPLPAWPDVPTRFLLCTEDRMFPSEFQRRVVAERLGIAPDELRSGHLAALAHPHELVEQIEAYRAELEPSRT